MKIKQLLILFTFVAINLNGADKFMTIDQFNIALAIAYAGTDCHCGAAKLDEKPGKKPELEVKEIGPCQPLERK